jgi:HD superfamily phosphodiesterase
MLTESQVYSLHQKYSHGIYKDQILDLVWTHSCIVKEISLKIANNLVDKYCLNTDLNLLTVGALIHDLGFYSCFDDNFKKLHKYFLHGELGYRIVLKEKLPETLARFCSTHIGIGVSPNIPITTEEEIVTYADCFHSKGHPSFSTYSEIEDEVSKFSQDNLIILKRFQDKFDLPDLSKLEIKYRSWHQQINQWLDSLKTV